MGWGGGLTLCCLEGDAKLPMKGSEPTHFEELLYVKPESQVSQLPNHNQNSSKDRSKSVPPELCVEAERAGYVSHNLPLFHLSQAALHSYSYISTDQQFSFFVVVNTTLVVKNPKDRSIFSQRSPLKSQASLISSHIAPLFSSRNDSSSCFPYQQSCVALFDP